MKPQDFYNLAVAVRKAQTTFMSAPSMENLQEKLRLEQVIDQEIARVEAVMSRRSENTRQQPAQPDYDNQIPPIPAVKHRPPETDGEHIN